MNAAILRRSKGRQSGFVLVLAVFMLVMLASIAAYLLTISNLQVQTAAQDELGARAYQSARTGIDWGAYQILRAPAQAFATACVAGATTQTIAPPTPSALNAANIGRGMPPTVRSGTGRAAARSRAA